MEYLAGNIEIENNPFELAIWDSLAEVFNDFPGIMGYKIPSLGMQENVDIPSFIIRSHKFGIKIIDVISEKITDFDDENEFWQIENGTYVFSRDLATIKFKQELLRKLEKDSSLFNLRLNKWNEEIDISTHLIFVNNTFSEIDSINKRATYPLLSNYAAQDYKVFLSDLIKEPSSINTDNMDIIDSVLDGSDVFHKVKKKKVLDEPENINDFIKKSLNYTFKLDKIQRQIALQVPQGPQRIRGLAGTGKTVILCMKAALAHKAFPELKILFVFNTQSMYNQVQKTITEYYINEAQALPNWNNLHILHAWGGSSKPGVYFNTANLVGIKPKNLMNVRGTENPLELIYTDLLAQSKKSLSEIYDIVLIDEAQDFSPAFFETIFYLTKSIDGDRQKKRIIWAYDEFQSLSELKIANPEELFGFDETGKPNMMNNVLEGSYKGNIEKDFVLPNSYRNPRISLMAAHGLALGLYSAHGKVPMEKKRDWEARGYKVHVPDKSVFNEGDYVTVERPEEYSKNILEHLIKEHGRDEMKLLSYKKHPDILSELNETVSRILILINQQKVEPEEILVINLDTKSAKEQFEHIRQQLDIRNVKAITPGFIESTDSFKEPGFVTLSTTFRAKGNEANIVLIINSQRVITDATFRMRNAIFVAITRSRGWCYLYSHGKGSDELENEIKAILRDYPHFNFLYPSEDQIRRRLTIIHSDKDVEKADQDIDKILSNDAYKALLVEKLSKNSELLKEIKKIQKNNDN